ncbi:MAG: hypothetical protein ACEB74_13670 [Desulfovibrio aminophilus]|uniref:hypothetical protein n=1 Tax=Desulfovibrio aminophilus TaxID=81425 RepID=UPI002A4D3D1F|nr:hypothetical protein [Desulfovibrionaceae bacterium]
MNQYKVRYIWGPQGKLSATSEEIVEAGSLDEALSRKSAWPVERSFHGDCAWAKNPGTSLYYVEAWEAKIFSGRPPAAR